MSDLFDSHPIIPVVVIEDAETAEPLAEALLKGGIKIIEITFRTAAAAESIRRVRTHFPEMLTGAGTVVTQDQASAAIDAGSQFGLAPGTDLSTVKFFQERGIPFIPGVMTPTDIQAAISVSCRHIKFFPAGAAGGVKMLQSMAAPYKNLGVRFCPTGGVSVSNMNDYLALPEVFAVGGTWIASAGDIANGNWDAITENALFATQSAQRENAISSS